MTTPEEWAERFAELLEVEPGDAELHAAETVVAEAIADEREACASIADAGKGFCPSCSATIASTIRARTP